MTRQEFINFIDIDQEGHYPFQCFAKKQNGETVLITIAISDIVLVYLAVKALFQAGVEYLHFSADFLAKIGTMNTDFVGIHTYQDSQWSLVLLPYDEECNRGRLVTKGEVVDQLKFQAITYLT
jgi:hypothetical protein